MFRTVTCLMPLELQEMPAVYGLDSSQLEWHQIGVNTRGLFTIKSSEDVMVRLNVWVFCETKSVSYGFGDRRRPTNQRRHRAPRDLDGTDTSAPSAIQTWRYPPPNGKRLCVDARLVLEANGPHSTVTPNE